MENVHPFPHQQVDERVPEHIEAERYVLGDCAMDHRHIPAVREALTGSDFYHPAHEVIWRAINDLYNAGQPTQPLALRMELERRKELQRAGGAAYVIDLGNYISGDPAYYADQIRTAAELREEANIGRQIVQRATAPDAEPGAGAALYETFLEKRRARQAEREGSPTNSFLNWGSFFATDFGKVELLPGRILAPGQQIAVVGEGKAGKSLLVQEWLWRMATGQPFLGDRAHAPVPVLYVDAENGHQDIQARLISYGAGPDRMGLLTYASFPAIRPLDTPGGGQDLLRLVDESGAEVICLDTVSRFISGPENDADTWLSLYRCTLLPLKRAGKSSIRLDHLGKDSERGARGSSAKTQDVDHVWELRAQGGGALTLKRTYTRTGIGPDHFAIVRQARQHGDTYAPGGTRHILMTWDTETPPTPGSDEDIIRRLDAADVPADAGNRVVRQALQKLQISAGNDKIARIVRARQNPPSDVSGNRSAEAFQQTFPGNVSRNTGGTEETAGQTFPGTVAETPGTPPVPPASPPEGGNGEGNDVPKTSKTPLCTVCGHELHGFRLDRGYDTCIGCDPTTGSHPDAA